MTAALAFAVQLCLPAAFDVDYRQRVVERPERHPSPASVLKEFARAPREFVERKSFGFSRSAVSEPGLERVKQRTRAGVTRLAQGVGAATAGAGDAQPQ